jgi:8-oxo-dGTP diphosphatase
VFSWLGLFGAGNTFLPGGHVEFGESAEATIARECLEEFGSVVRVGEFVGVWENAFEEGGRAFHEVTLVFAGELEGSSAVVVAREGHLEFQWWPVEDLAAANLLPVECREVVRAQALGGPGPVWSSNLSGNR